MKFKSEGDYFGVSRIVLHRILNRGLEDIIHYGYRFEHFDTLESGRARVHFANGQMAEGDLVIAADGVNSAVRKQVLGESFEPSKIGVDAVVGKIFIEDFDNPFEGLEFMGKGVSVITGVNGRAMFFVPQIYSDTAKREINNLFCGSGTTHEAQLRLNATGDDILLLGNGNPKALVDDARDFVLWAYLTAHSEEDIPAGSKEGIATSQRDLTDAVLKHMQRNNWASSLIDLVMKTDINTVGTWPLRTSPPIADLSQRKPYNLSFLGDSIHASISSLFLTDDSASYRWRRG